MSTSSIAASLLGLTLLVGCGGGSYSSAPATPKAPPPPPPGTPNSVVITDNTFTPATLTTAGGSTVTFTWNTCRDGDAYGGGSNCTAHDVTFDDGPTSGSQSSGAYSRVFTVAGNYPYHCRIHGTGMSGTIVVK